MNNEEKKGNQHKMKHGNINSSPSPYLPNSLSIKIIMADDHPIVRQGLRRMIETDKSIEILAEANNGEAALELISENEPNVVVLDIDMPKMDGFAVVRELQKSKLPIEVIFLTMYSEEEMFQAAMDLGVKGYILKDGAVNDIIAAIKSVAIGRPFISPALSALLLKRRRRIEELESEQPGLHLLTATEKRILKLIAEEKTSKEIGEELFISHRTVETHRSNICRKLNLQGTLSLVRFAVAHKSEL